MRLEVKYMGFEIVFQLVNTLLLIFIIFGTVVLIRVLIKLNKALDIWLKEKNNEKSNGD